MKLKVNCYTPTKTILEYSLFNLTSGLMELFYGRYSRSAGQLIYLFIYLSIFLSLIINS